MRCQNCSTENPEGAKFCIQCGNPFQRLCQKCGFGNPSEARFCAQCGAPLETTALPRAPAEPNHGLTGERRHLTVLFCDLVNSTNIAAQLDPEEWREIVADYHRAASQAIERFGGHVAQYQGDGVMAYFGYPEAHDNDAERAARAGLAIVDALSRLNQQSARPELSARIGIDSGTVVVGASAGRDADVFGDTPNIAARVQTAAEPGTVLVTADTHRLVSGLFVVEDRGAQVLKGIERPVQLYRVVQPSGVRGRLQAAAAAHGLTPFVGREDELGSLVNRWEYVLDGEGQVVLIVGEAGIGKSRLVQRFHEQIADTPHTWVEAAAAPLYQNTPFYPISEVLRQLVWEQSLDRLGDYLRDVQIKDKNPGRENALGEEQPDQPANEQLAQLQSGLMQAGLKPAEAIPLIAPLLNLPIPAKYLPSPLSPERQRRRLLATLVEWLLGAAYTQPLGIVIEDLHWADPSTLELIQLLVEQGSTARLLLLHTARPEFRAQWALRAHHTQITLNRLSTRNVRTIVAQVAAQKALAEETIAAVVERTGGVPLFVEELTRAVLESGAKLAGREIPVTLHDSLMARLDRLGPAKEVIQVGAVIGGEFSYELLYAVHPIEEEDLQRALRSLTDAELLYVRGIAPDATYQFKHALIRDAAYEALLRSRRKELHRQVAGTIDEKFPGLKEAHPEVLARHWTEAGETESAIAEWARAAKAAETRSAFKEAQESYEQALALLNLLPESAERDVRELELRQFLLPMLYFTRGYSAPGTIDVRARAAALAEKSGNLTQLVTLMHATGHCAHDAGDFAAAGTMADQALELALRDGNPTNLALVYELQVVTRFARADLAGVEKHFEAGLKFFDDPGFRQAPSVLLIAFCAAALTAHLLGRIEVARERIGQMMAATNKSNPFESAFSGSLATLLHLQMREYEQAEAVAARALDLSEKNQLPQAIGFLRCLLGRARVKLGRPTEGIALIRLGMASLAEIGTHVMDTSNAVALAEAQLAGAPVDGLDAVERASRQIRIH